MTDKSLYDQRKSLGILGGLLPFLCLIFGSLNNDNPFWYYTMSATYFTAANTVFVGLLFAVGLFLISYHGYDWKDRLVNIPSGITALGVAIFPCGATELLNVGLFNLPVKVSNILHGVFAGIFFCLLAVNILWLFRKTSGVMTTQKKKRNLVYLICGSIIAVMVLLMLLYTVFGWFGFLGWTFEMVMLVSFAVAWLVKGEAIFKDKE